MEKIEEMKKARWQTQRALCQRLMDATRPNRKQWILAERPSTKQVFTKFPLFREKEVVSGELRYD